MPYTSHGHPFGVIDADAPQPGRTRCGGTALCVQCRNEAIASQAAAATMAALTEGRHFTVMGGDGTGLMLRCEIDPTICQWWDGTRDDTATLAELLGRAAAHALRHVPATDDDEPEQP